MATSSTCRRNAPPNSEANRRILPLEEDTAIGAIGDKDAAPADAAIDPKWLAEFEAAAKRPLALRWRYAFIHTYKPVLDDATYRSFDTMEEYRHWCEQNLPPWLGYGRVHLPPG